MPVTGNKSYHPQSLSIRLRADGFSFFVCDPQANSLIRGEHFSVPEGENLATRLQTEIKRPDYFNRQIDQACVLVDTPSMHVPLEEFRRDEAADLFHFTLADHDARAERVAYTILPELESAELYAIPFDVEEAILQYYPMARFFAARAMLTERLLHHYQDATDEAHRLYVCLRDDRIDLVAFNDNRLRFANSFITSQAANIQYFVLNTWQMLGLDAEADRLVILSEAPTANAGAASAASDLAALQQGFGLYLRHVDTLSPESLFPRVPLAREKQIPLDLKALLLNRI